jgi:DNA (cytosine-5)-methyltransferase 1
MGSGVPSKEPLRVAELFAGVGGFRLGLEGVSARRSPDGKARRGVRFKVVWSNQWEPATKAQHASDCYVARFGDEGHSCEDIAVVVDDLRFKRRTLPDFDVLVGGFPCQDYSVAKVLSQAAGISGRKGVLWWEIYRLLEEKRPKHLILENVDRLLKSPAAQRGRDFAVILWCLHSLGSSNGE